MLNHYYYYSFNYALYRQLLLLSPLLYQKIFARQDFPAPTVNPCCLLTFLLLSIVLSSAPQQTAHFAAVDAVGSVLLSKDSFAHLNLSDGKTNVTIQIKPIPTTTIHTHGAV